MKKAMLFSFSGLCSALAGAALLWVSDSSIFAWGSLGYLFVVSIWLSTLLVNHGVKSGVPIGRRIGQVAISIFWWPAAIIGGLIGLVVSQPIMLQPLMHSIVMYSVASAASIGLGLLSLNLSGARLSVQFYLALVAMNLGVLVAGLSVYNRFQTPPFILSNHYDLWVVFLLFVPMAAVNGWMYGIAYPINPTVEEQLVNSNDVASDG